MENKFFKSVEELKKTSTPGNEIGRKYNFDVAEIFKNRFSVVSVVLYDNDSSSTDFTSQAAAEEYFRRVIRFDIEEKRTHKNMDITKYRIGAGSSIEYDKGIPCSNFGLELCDFDPTEAIAYFVENPPTSPEQTDSGEIYTHFHIPWDEIRPKPKEVPLNMDVCYCKLLQKGELPEDPEPNTIHTNNFVFEDENIYRTHPHHGSVKRGVCTLCDTTVYWLLVECEGFSGSIHSYYSFPSLSDLEMLGSDYEHFVNTHAGIYSADRSCYLYDQTKVKYRGLPDD